MCNGRVRRVNLLLPLPPPPLAVVADYQHLLSFVAVVAALDFFSAAAATLQCHEEYVRVMFTAFPLMLRVFYPRSHRISWPLSPL